MSISIKKYLMHFKIMLKFRRIMPYIKKLLSYNIRYDKYMVSLYKFTEQKINLQSIIFL